MLGLHARCATAFSGWARRRGISSWREARRGSSTGHRGSAERPRERRRASTGAPLCPAAPSKIVCIGRNYAAHAKELGHDVPAEPLLFLKPPSSLLGPGGAVVLPADSARVEHEAELVVVLGKRASHVARADALAHVFGYTAACDVTARDLQRKDVQFTRAKGFDTFCPIGPWVETQLEPASARVQCRVNGQTRQDGTTDRMIFDVPTLVAYVSRAMTLEPGDVILTGTPEGVGPLARVTRSRSKCPASARSR